YYSIWKRTSGPVRKRSPLMGVIFCSHVPWVWNSSTMVSAMFSNTGIANVYMPDIKAPGRHKGKGIPVACADGHIEIITRDEIYTTSFTSQPWGTRIYYHSSW